MKRPISFKPFNYSIPVFLLILLISKSGYTQDYHTYQAFEATMLQVSGDTHIESRLKKAVIILSNNSNQLKVRISIPYRSINYMPGDDPISSATSISFDLKMTINPWKIQDDITSNKVFITQGVVTMNNITKAVKVQYIPSPAGPDQDGDFNLSMIIQFDPRDFGLDEWLKNSQIIIKISDAVVNRV